MGPGLPAIPNRELTGRVQTSEKPQRHRAMPRPVNALIVDDEAHVRVLLVTLLKQLGVKTTWEASDGTAGIAQAALHNPEVVLLDINLPEISGLDVLSRLKADHPNIPVIIVSAQTTVRTVNRANELGAAGFVVKYAAKSEVAQMLSDVLDKIGGVAGGDPPGEGEKPAETA
jgi:DNA-binding NarL/FixJ family response regulator